MMVHPKAYLSKIRNVQAGLLSRTKILTAIEAGSSTASEMAKKSRLTYSCTLHHLNLMRREKLVERRGKRRGSFWFLTKFGQQRL
jgi:predicted transcriptional regulator